MNWKIFALAMFIGEALVALQGLVSWNDGYFSAPQMQRKGYRGYSFLQHGGMWADFFLITPLVAYLVGKYNFAHTPTVALIFAAALILWNALAVFVFAPDGKAMPEAHTHGGNITAAGWILILYAGIATGIIAMVYLPGYATPPISNVDIMVVSAVLFPWLIIGVTKFSPEWEWKHPEVLLVAIGAFLGVAILAAARLILQ